MKIRTYRFKGVSGSLAARPFFEYLLQLDKRDIHYNGGKRLLYLNDNGDHFSVLILSPKDQKTFLALQSAGEKVSIKRNELEAGTQLLDFNILIFNPVTMDGIYLHYHGGMSLHTVQGFVNRHYKSAVKEIVLKDKKADLIEKGFTKEEVDAELNRLASADFGILPVYRQEDINEVIDRMDDIRAVSLVTKTQDDFDNKLSPFTSADLDYTAYKWKIRPEKVKEGRIKAALLKVVSLGGIIKGSVKGRIDGDIRDVPFKIDPVSFDENDYDTVLQDFDIDPSDFESTGIYTKAKATAVRLGVCGG